MITIDELTTVRVEDPARIGRLLAERTAPRMPADGRLMMIACDHPARGSLSAAGRPMAMADRRDLLARLVIALSRPGVDGLLGTADIIEDLLLLGALDDKIVFGSLNRGGLAGTGFEADDRMTAYDVVGTTGAGLQGAKMLLRIVLDDPATADTLQTCGRAVTELNRAGRIALVEPFLARHAGGRIVNDLTPEAVITSIAIAQGLGASSAYTWLKIPVTERMEEVAAATTLPTLLLGGDPVGEPEDTYAQWESALKLPPVRGLMVGRSLLYPSDDDVAVAVDTAAGMVH
ncbi:deoxyribose-phosphate aldolase [Microlunatus sp. Gsoil 973]|uniref:Cgl0159 family (beta/alpha)8-fold protein n=1 Tax=Microlunatus sp. Gsoil 973 TaxID=2672569 RepID=UPI0012B4786A|nr:deoxyribose-phosphate aldolase [Microlunatus sp. Gsoil 973]QGN31492.1 deoxyribose-phosphate aldolase [Microlunatus sp. Gsoil 973]